MATINANRTTAEVKAIASKLAAEMPGWTVNIHGDDCRHGFSLIKADTPCQQLWVRVQDVNHYEVSGNWPHYKSYTYRPQNSDGLEHVPDQVKISTGKTMAQVAKEIDRRLLTTYLPAVLKMQGKINRERANDNARGATLAELCQLAGHGEPTESGARQGESCDSSSDVYKIKVDHFGGKVNLTTSGLSLDAARELIALVAALKAKHPLPAEND